MKSFHWILTGMAAAILLGAAALLVYDVMAMESGGRWLTLSALWSKAHPAATFAAGCGIGGAIGFVAGHLWPVWSAKSGSAKPPTR